MPKRRKARQASRREFLKGSAAVAAAFTVAGKPCFAKKAHAASGDNDSHGIADDAPARSTASPYPVALRGAHVHVTIDEKKREWTVWDTHRNHRLMIVPATGCFTPALNGVKAEAKATRIAHDGKCMTLHFEASGVSNAQVEWRVAGDGLEMVSRFTATEDCELNRLNLFPRGTKLNLDDLVNFRHRHHTCQTWPELNLGGKGCETDTYSTDWQFAPHPTMFLLRKGGDHLFFGALDLPRAFGMYFKAAESLVEHWYLDYGSAGCGQRLRAGETFQSPRFCLFLDRGKSVHETVARWTGLLIRQGLIPDPKKKTRHAWHKEKLYCTWGDQGARSGSFLPAELQDQTAQAGSAQGALNEGMVREALATIRRERLPIRIVLLDDGWEVARGQWEADPQRFPHLRKLVDDIHAAGMKVMCWWAWPEIADNAQVNPAYLIANGKRNRHGCRMWDFSHPRTQREYLEPLFRRLLSSDAGCYDFDGLKTDFVADKVHADMPVHDPTWRGEENYIYRMCKLFHAVMRRYKPDACHLGCAGHPYLAEFTEINRTYDVAGSDVREHEQRGLMLEATVPGCPVSMDLHSFAERFDDYFETACRHGWAIELGNILMMRRDPWAAWEPADRSFYDLLRQGLSQSSPRQRI